MLNLFFDFKKSVPVFIHKTLLNQRGKNIINYNCLLIMGAFSATCCFMSAQAVSQVCTWSSVGTGLGGTSSADVRALTVFDDGSGPALFAGGKFTQAGGQPASRVAKWDGSSWMPLGSQKFGIVSAMTVFDDGSGPALFVGGSLDGGIARWDGLEWSSLGSGLTTSSGNRGEVFAMTVFDDGSGPALIVGGDFDRAGGDFANNIARWDGSSWSRLGSGTNSAVRTLEVFEDNTGHVLYAGGSFDRVGVQQAAYIARWNGVGWFPLGSEVNGTVYTFQVFDDGAGEALFVGGNFTQAGGMPAAGIARWSGTSWSPMGQGPASVRAMAVFDDGLGRALYAGGAFTQTNGTTSQQVAKWNGNSWEPLGSGMNNQVLALRAFDDGSGPALYAGGRFVLVNGFPLFYIASWQCEPPCGPPLTVTLDPQDQSLDAGETLILETDAEGGDPITYQWFRDGQELTDGGRVSGSGTSSLTITDVSQSDAGFYEAQIADDCGELAKVSATILINEICLADLDNNDQLNFFDLAAFLVLFQIQDNTSDWNGDGEFNFFDLSAYLSDFNLGCP